MTSSRYSRPILSICIPTYNRCEFLDYLLTSIIDQIGEDSEEVQIIVSDNASQDSTLQVIAKYQSSSINLKYTRMHKNLGFTQNLNSAVSASNGIYCWLMGDDDALRKGSINFIINLLKIDNPDVAITNRFLCDLNMNPLSEENFIPTIKNRKIFHFNNRDNTREYFSQIESTIGLFNFMSNIIVRKESWMNTNEIITLSRSLFPHVFKVIDILYNHQGRLLYVPEATVFARTGNDRLDEIHNGSSFKAWQLHFVGNIEIADYYFKYDSELYDQFLSPIRRIIENGKEYYLTLARKDGYLNEALSTLTKLKIFHDSSVNMQKSQ